MIISVRVPDSPDVSLIPPTDSRFDELARPLIGEPMADLALKLKPLLAIVENRSPLTIVSASIMWRVRYGDGRHGSYWGHMSEPEIICGDTITIRGTRQAIGPGGRSIHANGILIQGYTDDSAQGADILRQFAAEKDRILRNAVELQIDLNAVIFEDGTLIGPDDDAKLAAMFSAYVEEKQRWYRLIIDALDAGQSVDDAYAPVREYQAEQIRRMKAGERDPIEIARDHRRLWRQQAAAEAMSWRRRFSDEELPSQLKRAIHLEPFMIRKRPVGRQ